MKFRKLLNECLSENKKILNEGLKVNRPDNTRPIRATYLSVENVKSGPGQMGKRVSLQGYLDQYYSNDPKKADQVKNIITTAFEENPNAESLEFEGMNFTLTKIDGVPTGSKGQEHLPPINASRSK